MTTESKKKAFSNKNKTHSIKHKGEKNMSQQDIIRAWKDPEFRNSLSEEQRSQLP